MQKRFTNSRDPQVRGKSSSLDILGAAPQRPAIKREWMENYRNLNRLRDEFEGDLEMRGESVRQELPVLSEHMADAASDSFERDCALALLSSSSHALLEIEQAINRIVSGSYGTCELTGEPIEPERLKAIPWARFSKKAQAEMESRGAVERPHLGRLGILAAPANEEDIEEEETDSSFSAKGKKQVA